MKYESDIGRVRQHLSSVSRLEFGRQYRLEVALVVGALEDPIWSRRLSQILGLPENQVASELSRLLEAGALTPFPEAHDRRKLFQVARHPIWAFARDLSEKTIREAEGEEAMSAYWQEVCEGAPREIPERQS
jgi:hypothetical protein